MFDEEGNLTRTWIIFFERNFLGARAGGNVTNNTTNNTTGGTQYDRFVFGLATINDLSTGTSVTPKITVERACKLLRWRITANTAPVGANIVVDIKRNGSSIFAAGLANKIVLPAGSIRANNTNFLSSPLNLAYQDELIPDVLQVGTTTPGFRIQIQLVGQIL